MSEKPTVAIALVDEVGEFEPRQAQGRTGDPVIAALAETVSASHADSQPRAIEVAQADVDKAEQRLHYAAAKVGLSAKVLGYGKGAKRGHVKVVYQGVTRRAYKPRNKTSE